MVRRVQGITRNMLACVRVREMQPLLRLYTPDDSKMQEQGMHQPNELRQVFLP